MLTLTTSNRSGSARAVSRKARRARRSGLSRLLDQLESRVLLSISYSGADMAGTWGQFALSSTGTIQFDAANNITGGNLSLITGNTFIPSGNYIISSTGGVQTVTTLATKDGAMDASKDVIVSTTVGDQGTRNHSESLGVLVKEGNVGFTTSSLTGAWSLFFNGDSGGSTGFGSMVTDGTGNITSGSFVNGKGSGTLTGNYSVNASGQVNATINLVENGSNFSQSYTGQLNAGDDVLALSPTDLPAAGSNGSPLLVTLVHSSGTYSNADLATGAPWTLIGDGFKGQLTFGANGIVSGTATDSTGEFVTLLGGYSVSSNGSFTASVTASAASGTKVFALHGEINGTRDLAALEHIPNSNGTKGNSDTLMFLVNSGGHAPTLTKVTPFGTALDTLPFTFSGNTLLHLSNAGDTDGDTVNLVVEAVHNGTLLVNGSAVTAGTTTIAADDTVTWTPTAGSEGLVDAFSIEATDGSLTSGIPVPVPILTVTRPVISIVAAPPTAVEGGHTGGFIITRTGGLIGQSLTVDFSIGGSAGDGVDYNVSDPLSGNATGSVTFAAGKSTEQITIAPVDTGKADGPKTVLLTLVNDANHTYRFNANAQLDAATVTITDQAPTVSIIANKPNASELNGSASGMGQFTLIRTGSPANALTVDYAISGTAVDGTDYNVGNPLSGNTTGTVTFAAGKSIATINIDPADFNKADGPKTVILTLEPDGTPSSYHLNPLDKFDSATVTIFDHAPTVGIIADKPNASEINGTGSGMGQFLLVRTGPTTSPLTVTYEIGGTAVDGTDYNASNPLSGNSTGTVTFDAGKATANINIDPVNTGVADGPKTVILTLEPDGTPSDYHISQPFKTATVTIRDGAPTVAIVADRANASEINGSGSGMGQFVVLRSGSDTAALTVTYEIGGSAIDGTDYNATAPLSGNATGTITIPAGKASANINIIPVDSNAADGPENVVLTLTNSGTSSLYHVATGPLGTATVKIAQDTRPIIFTSDTPISPGVLFPPATISYEQLVGATGVEDAAGKPITFIITKVLSGTLLKGGVAVVPGTTTIATGDSVVWTPHAGASGTVAAFTLLAMDGTSVSTSFITISVTT